MDGAVLPILTGLEADDEQSRQPCRRDERRTRDLRARASNSSTVVDHVVVG